MTGLDIAGLEVAYGAGPPVLRGVSLSVAPGERVALLGASGSGKSTLLRAVAGFEPPRAGDVRLDGQSLVGVPAERRGIGLVFQAPLLFPHLTVRENVAFGPKVQGRSASEIAHVVQQMLARTDLEAHAASLPRQLSGGQQQRAALARTLAARPRALLLDEPLSALDTPLRRELRGWLAALLDDEALPAVLVTHDLEEALAFGHRLGVLERGTLAQQGTPEAVYARPATAAVARLTGAENLIPGTQRGHEVHTPLGTLRALTPRTGPVHAVLRADAFEMDPQNGTSARLLRATFAGSGLRAILEIGSLTLTALLPHGTDPTPGTSVPLRPKSDVWTVPDDKDEETG